MIVVVTIHSNERAHGRCDSNDHLRPFLQAESLVVMVHLNRLAHGCCDWKDHLRLFLQAASLLWSVFTGSVCGLFLFAERSIN